MPLLDSNTILRYFTVSSSEKILLLYSFLWFRHNMANCEADAERNTNNSLVSGPNTPRIVKFGYKEFTVKREG